MVAVTTNTVPTYMNTPTVNLAANNVNPTWIYVEWAAITSSAQTGGASPIYYELSWNNGDGIWVTLTSQAAGLAYSFNVTTVTPFASGQLVYFRVRA